MVLRGAAVVAGGAGWGEGRGWEGVGSRCRRHASAALEVAQARPACRAGGGRGGAALRSNSRIRRIDMKGGRWGGGGGQGKPGFTLSSLDASCSCHCLLRYFRTCLLGATSPTNLDLKPCAWQQLTRLEGSCHYLVDVRQLHLL